MSVVATQSFTKGEFEVKHKIVDLPEFENSLEANDSSRGINFLDSESPQVNVVDIPEYTDFHIVLDSGVADHVVDNMQAQRKGVQVGWRITDIDDSPYSNKLFAKRRESGLQYRLAFSKAGVARMDCMHSHHAIEYIYSKVLQGGRDRVSVHC